MGWVDNTPEGRVGKRVRLTEDKMAISGGFTKGSIVTISDITPMRGYSFRDDEGHEVSEAGWDGFTVIPEDNN